MATIIPPQLGRILGPRSQRPILNSVNSPQGFQQLSNFSGGNILFGSQQPASNNNIVGNEGRLASREQQFGKGIGAFDRFYQSLTVDGEINNSDRDQLRSTLERFVREGLIEGYQARNLYKRYGLSPTKVIPGKGRRSLSSFGKK